MPVATLSLPPPSYATPVGGASLILAFRPSVQQQRTFLIVGSNGLAAIRAFAALEAGFKVIVADSHGLDHACAEVRWRVDRGEISWKDLPAAQSSGSADALETFVNSLPDDVSLVCVTDTLIPVSPASSPSFAMVRSPEAAEVIANACRSRRIPVNVTDMPRLCDFTFPACHRFTKTSPHEEKTTAGPLQLCITTNGQGCRLASRLRREIIASLPKNVGMAIENVGRMREMAASQGTFPVEESDEATTNFTDTSWAFSSEEDATAAPPLNSPVPQDRHHQSEGSSEARSRRMRWIAQLSEYWPLERLASLTMDDMEEALAKVRKEDSMTGERCTGDDIVVTPSRCPRKSKALSAAESEPGRAASEGAKSSLAPSSSVTSHPSRSTNLLPNADTPDSSTPLISRHALSLSSAPPLPLTKGRIMLVGSGPGHPSLLTLAAHKALTQLGTLILSDKLVPAQVLALVPKDRNVTVHIAKKYPGNSEGAQNEFMDMAVEGAKRGEIVVRLKQGDPFLYGRGGEEVLHFRQAGFEPLVIPGISSALAAPLLANIPVTQRGVSEALIVCTGVGRSGRDVRLPGYVRERSLVILMGVARLGAIVEALTKETDVAREVGGRRIGAPYPHYTPIAIVERASCPDQRVVSSTLAEIEGVLGRCGEQRTPAMMFVGWAALALSGNGDLEVLNDSLSIAEGHDLERKDLERVARWLGEERCVVREGLDDGWALF